MTTPFEISDRLVDDIVALNPLYATFWGVEGDHGTWGQAFSLAGEEAGADMARRYRAELAPHVDHPDPVQRLAARSVVGALDEKLEAFEEGDHFRELRHLGSPLHTLRNVFDLMPAGTDDEREAILGRLETVDQALRHIREMSARGQERGINVARRQAASVAEQARHLAGPDSALLGVVAKLGDSVDPRRLEEAVSKARAAAADFADWLVGEYLPDAAEADGAGQSVYSRSISSLVGRDIDPVEAYQWGWGELGRLIAEMERVGSEILPGAGWQEVRKYLDTDPSGIARSTDGLLAFAREVLDQAVEDLAGVHFDVPDEIRPLTVQLAPPGGALGVYYIGPSEDLRRPGGIWYAIGDRTEFPLYQHRSTAYHEGFPGHHLQIATARYLRDRLSRAQRLLVHCIGYTEGWGMYAEVLMGELGYLAEPAHYFGMLAKQMYRASRVVVDIGLHLGLVIPAVSEVAAGQRWTFENAVDFMGHYGMQNPVEAEAEVLRYLGWPGQAPCYKLGEREILDIREETRDRLGDDFDLKAFHSVVLGTGAIRLDLLREVVRAAL